jgi:hypothetical protein
MLDSREHFEKLSINAWPFVFENLSGWEGWFTPAYSHYQPTSKSFDTVSLRLGSTKKERPLSPINGAFQFLLPSSPRRERLG